MRNKESRGEASCPGGSPFLGYFLNVEIGRREDITKYTAGMSAYNVHQCWEILDTGSESLLTLDGRIIEI